jgi:peptidoglycan/xylan/chitin deacetylase (PgdA/CDA1 family)
MYHYVRNVQETDYPDIKALSVEKFANQIEYIAKNYTVISLRDYVDLIMSKKDIPQKACVMTFDDGLKDHYTHVFAVLKKHHMPATFFVPTSPMTDGVVLPVHKVHFLLGNIGAKTLASEINDALKTQFPSVAQTYFIDGAVKKESRYRWDDVLTANVKSAMLLMPADIKHAILRGIFAKYLGSEKDFCKELYMDFNHMRQMQQAGMEFGSHSVTHPSLPELSPQEQLQEMTDSKIILEKELGVPITSFSYPYGKWNEVTLDMVKKTGYVCALSAKVDVNMGDNVDLFALNRLDTNDLPQHKNN